ncbi:uncharacterized protein LOC141719775 [Apium graveolens]|uniref:uncharacterized protein LOC141719775 n=1 Tax=Apium graveolens TaxID=4045 RepID=UPI003D795765
MRDDRNCALLAHIGKDSSSFYRNAERACDGLMNQSHHIVQRFEKHTSKQIIENILRLKVSITVAKYLAFQGSAFRGYLETSDSFNGGNFKEYLNVIASYSDKVKKEIRDEIGDAKFCLIIDDSKHEQISTVLQFVDKYGYVREIFFGLVHVKDTATITLKEAIF